MFQLKMDTRLRVEDVGRRGLVKLVREMRWDESGRGSCSQEAGSLFVGTAISAFVAGIWRVCLSSMDMLVRVLESFLLRLIGAVWRLGLVGRDVGCVVDEMYWMRLLWWCLNLQ